SRIDREILDEPGSGNDLQPASDAVAIRFLSDRLNADPAFAITAIIAQYVGLLADVGDHDVDIPVVVQIAEGGAPACPYRVEHRPGIHGAEPAGEVPEQQWRLQILQIGRRAFDGVHHVTLCNEQVLPSVVIVVEQAGAPTGVRDL